MGGSGEGSDGVADLPPLEEAEAARGGRRVRGREGAEAEDEAAAARAEVEAGEGLEMLLVQYCLQVTFYNITCQHP